MNGFAIIIMAGGLGKRMNSNIPKVLHCLDNKPMLVKIIETSLLLKPKKIMIVVGKYKEIIIETIKKYISLDYLEFVDQFEAKGTGHAIKCSRNNLINTDVEDVLILSGDVPLISKETILNCLSNLNKCKIITTIVDEPSGLGRIILKNNKFIKIVEEKDCSNEEKKIKLINTGVYAFKKDILCKYILHLNNNNAQKEYYLTDIIEIIKENENIDIDMYEISKEKQYELTGVNTKQQLIDLSNLIKIKKD